MIAPFPDLCLLVPFFFVLLPTDQCSDGLTRVCRLSVHMFSSISSL